MSTQQPTEFTAYDFDKFEEVIAYSYNELQLQGIRTQISIEANNLMNLNPQELSGEDFKAQYKYHQGAIAALMTLLLLHERNKTELEQETVSEMTSELQFDRNKGYQL